MKNHCDRHARNRPGPGLVKKDGQAGNALVLAVLALAIVAGTCLWWFKSRPATMTRQAAEYFKTDPEIPRDGNAWFVLMGLDILPDRPAHEAGLQKFDSMRGQTAQGPVPPELEFTGDISAVSCWVNAQPQEPGCPDRAVVDALLFDNFDLLSRLDSLLGYSMAVQPRGTGQTVSPDLVENLYHLKMAELVMLIEQDRPEDSLEIWVNGWRQLRMFSVARVDLHWRDLFAELLGQWAGLLPYIIVAEPEQLTKGGARRMVFLLRPLDEEGLDFEARMQHLGHLLVHQTLAQSDLAEKAREDLAIRLKNIYAANAAKISKALAQPGQPDIYKALMELRAEDNWPAKNVPGEMSEDIGFFVEEGVKMLIGAFQADLANNDYSRMFILDIDAFDKHVPAGRMQAYLDIQQEFMQSHVTGKPFIWDPERHDIYFVAPDNLERRLNLLRFRRNNDDGSATSAEE